MSPRVASGLVAFLALWRVAAAMPAAPASFMVAIARLRIVAMTWGPLPVRTWEWSSRWVTSRMWCRASMRQWPRIHPASWAGLAWLAVRLVIA